LLLARTLNRQKEISCACHSTNLNQWHLQQTGRPSRLSLAHPRLLPHSWITVWRSIHLWQLGLPPTLSGVGWLVMEPRSTAGKDSHPAIGSASLPECV
jgi:hypothetical protein